MLSNLSWTKACSSSASSFRHGRLLRLQYNLVINYLWTLFFLMGWRMISKEWILTALLDFSKSKNLEMFYDALNSNVDAVRKANHDACDITLNTSCNLPRTRLDQTTTLPFSKYILIRNERLVQMMLDARWDTELM